MRLIYDDGETHIEATNGAVRVRLADADPPRMLKPDEAKAIGKALITAGKLAQQSGG